MKEARISNPISAKQAAEFELTESQGQALQRGGVRRSMTIVGRDGRGGSGAAVVLSDDRAAALTAKHVILSCAMTGELTAGFCAFEQAQTFEVDKIVICPNQDVGLAFFDHQPAWSYGWDQLLSGARASSSVRAGEGAISVGVPGAFKAEPDSARRTISHSVTFTYFTAVLAARSARLELDGYFEHPAMPESFAGMSGGAVVDLRGDLVGINVSESSRDKPERIDVIATSCFSDWLDSVAVSHQENVVSRLEVPSRIRNCETGEGCDVLLRGHARSDGYSLDEIEFSTPAGTVVVDVQAFSDFVPTKEPRERLALESIFEQVLVRTGLRRVARR